MKKKSREPSAATRLVDLAQQADIELWHSAAMDAFISVPVADHVEHYALKARPVRQWLARQWHEATHAVVSGQAMTDALLLLESLARYDGREYPVAVRVARRAGAVYLDLGDPTWRAVEITPAGWAVQPWPPVRLVRSRGLLPLAAPTCGGSIDLLREVVHVETEDDFRNLVGFLLGALDPEGPYPPLAITGPHGTGKSQLARLLRNLIDPQVAALRAEPRTIDDLMIAASRSHVVALDNISKLPPWLSDAICRLATGGALTKRELYTDADEVILDAIRPVILTSITDVVVRGDLLDRAIVLTLPALNPLARRSEHDLRDRFETAAPAILGALLDGVVSALQRERTVQIADLPRMADWATWVTAAEPGLGWDEGGIVAAYTDMQKMAIETAIDEDQVAEALRRLALPWEGTATALAVALTPADPPKWWPTTPRKVSAALKELMPGLRQIGLEVEFKKRTGRTRKICIRALGQAGEDAAAFRI